MQWRKLAGPCSQGGGLLTTTASPWRQRTWTEASGSRQRCHGRRRAAAAVPVYLGLNAFSERWGMPGRNPFPRRGSGGRCCGKSAAAPFMPAILARRGRFRLPHPVVGPPFRHAGKAGITLLCDDLGLALNQGERDIPAALFLRQPKVIFWKKMTAVPGADRPFSTLKPPPVPVKNALPCAWPPLALFDETQT